MTVTLPWTPMERFTLPGKMLIIVFGQTKWNWLRVA
jgi:hypothetical protein